MPRKVYELYDTVSGKLMALFVRGGESLCWEPVGNKGPEDAQNLLTVDIRSGI